MLKVKILTIFIILLPLHTHAASFDCSKATTKVETLVCTNSSVSAMDGILGKEFGEIKEILSEEEKIHLIHEQRVWLNKIRNKCEEVSCLTKVYVSRIQAIKDLRSNASNDPLVETNILLDAPIGKGYPEIKCLIDGDLVYSHYDDSGNAKNIVQFDFTTGNWTNLVEGKREPELITQNSKYIVFHTPHSASFPIEVLNRKTGESLSRIRLKNSVQEAFIKGDRLVLFQGSDFYSFKQRIAIFELPSLKFIEEVSIPGARLIAIKKNKIYTSISGSKKRDIVVFDNNLKELGRLPMPEPIEKINISCSPSIEQTEDDRALLTANCGEMHILNLKSFSISQSIPRYSKTYSTALYDDLIFTTAKDQTPENKNSIIVYSITSGKELARLPVFASTIAIKNDVLLAAGKPVSGRKASWPMKAYRINTDTIRNGQWQISQIKTLCKQAESLYAETNDIYGAINLCKASGIEKFADYQVLPLGVFPLLKQYTFWISQTFDRGHEAIPLFETLLNIKPDGEIEKLLSELRAKSKVLMGLGLDELSAEDKQTDFAKILLTGSQLTRAKVKDIDFGAFSNVFHFSGDKIYVGKFGCRNCLDYGASIGVLDRATFEEVAKIQIVPADDDYQDAIRSIASDDNSIYVSVGYRYEQKGRPDFFVIDKASLNITQKTQLGQVYQLILDDGDLLGCGCHFTSNQSCNEIDRQALTLKDAHGKICIRNGRGSEEVVSLLPPPHKRNFVAATKDYLVSRTSGIQGDPYTIFTKTGEYVTKINQEIGKPLSWPILVDGNNILFSETTKDGILIKTINVPSGKIQTLLGLPTASSRVAVPAIDKKLLFIGLGRDLLVYDLNKKQLGSYVKDFILGGFENNGHGLSISRLIIDQDRLLAITTHGERSRIIDLEDLKKYLRL